MAQSKKHNISVAAATQAGPRINSSLSSSNQATSRWQWLLVVMVMLASTLHRGRLRDFPLERDEGEYAYAGQLLLEGIPPYQLVFNMKLPGTYAAYAFMMAIFGQTAAGVHLGLIVVNDLTILFVFALGRRLYDASAGLIACATYALLSASQDVLGLAAHATHFVNLFATAGLLVLLRACGSGRLLAFFGSGLLLGMAFLMKQHGIFLTVFGIVYGAGRLFHGRHGSSGEVFRPLVMMVVGTLTPIVLTCVALACAGVIDNFLFWTISYASAYIQQARSDDAWADFKWALGRVVGGNAPLWTLAGCGLIGTWIKPEKRQSALFLSGFLFFSFLAICPGFYFRPHYFIILLPACALLVGAFAYTLINLGLQARLRQSGALTTAFIAFALACAWSIWQERKYLFEYSPVEACLETYKAMPFVEAPKIADYIARHTKPNDRIAVFGSEPEIYFYSRRHSATGFVYMYPLMENHPYALGMKRDFVSEIEDKKPTYYVVVMLPDSWNPNLDSIKDLVAWSNEYCRKHYDLVGVIDVNPAGAVYSWDEQVKPGIRGFPRTILVYRRKPGS